MQLTDTHCHIHEATDPSLTTETAQRYKKAGSPNPTQIVNDAIANGVTCMICVGTTPADSAVAISFAQTMSAGSQAHIWASIGIHPHEAQIYSSNQAALQQFAALAGEARVVAVGECGLDYFYEHSPREAQQAILRFQIELALKHALPMIFHVREAFDDFWPIFDSYPGIRGVIHSFSAGPRELEQILERGLSVGLNGIMTFTKDESQLMAAREVPLDRLVLETDAPFLTPTPYRGRMCEPKHVRVTAEFLANLRGESLEELASQTTANALNIFGLR